MTGTELDTLCYGVLFLGAERFKGATIESLEQKRFHNIFLRSAEKQMDLICVCRILLCRYHWLESRQI
jgi:hypothetical protein